MSDVEIRQYRTANGRTPFAEWLHDLRDAQGKRAVLARITRMEAGNRGDWKVLKGTGAGLFEVRIKSGPGYRLYCGQDGEVLVLLLCAGSKRTQTRDIEHARDYWQDYQRRR